MLWDDDRAALSSGKIAAIGWAEDVRQNLRLASRLSFWARWASHATCSVAHRLRAYVCPRARGLRLQVFVLCLCVFTICVRGGLKMARSEFVCNPFT